jgi:hypothetical protein
MTPDEMELELLRRLREEDPVARHLRRSRERAVTYARAWAAATRAGVTTDGERAAFIASRLYPELPAEMLNQYRAAVDERVRTTGRGIARPVDPKGT